MRSSKFILFYLWLLLIWFFRCVMALIWGSKGLCPCPICLVPHKELADLSKTHPRRTSDQSEGIFEQAKGLKFFVDKEKLFKPLSLRPVKVSVWLIDSIFSILIIWRVLFGQFQILMCIMLCHGTDFMHIILVCLENIYGLSLKGLWRILVDQQSRLLINGEFYFLIFGHETKAYL